MLYAVSLNSQADSTITVRLLLYSLRILIDAAYRQLARISIQSFFVALVDFVQEQRLIKSSKYMKII
jgi:hypothetical protein